MCSCPPPIYLGTCVTAAAGRRTWGEEAAAARGCSSAYHPTTTTFPAQHPRWPGELDGGGTINRLHGNMIPKLETTKKLVKTGRVSRQPQLSIYKRAKAISHGKLLACCKTKIKIKNTMTKSFLQWNRDKMLNLNLSCKAANIYYEQQAAWSF